MGIMLSCCILILLVSIRSNLYCRSIFWFFLGCGSFLEDFYGGNKLNCENCDKDIDGVPVCFDLNWVDRVVGRSVVVLQSEMDIHRFCGVECLIAWQKKKKIYQKCKRLSITRSTSL